MQHTKPEEIFFNDSSQFFVFLNVPMSYSQHTCARQSNQPNRRI